MQLTRKTTGLYFNRVIQLIIALLWVLILGLHFYNSNKRKRI